MNSANTWDSDISGGERYSRKGVSVEGAGPGIVFCGQPISGGNSSGDPPDTFELLFQRLRETVRNRVRQGEITESGLARLTQVSQPHLHNILKGKRLLTGELADRLLRQLRLGIRDLICASAPPATIAVPFLDGFLGPGFPFPSVPHPHLRYPFPTPELTTSRSPFFVEIRGNVPIPFRQRDIAMVDVDAQTRLQPLIGAWYAVNLGREINLRRVWVRGRSICLAEGVPVAGEAKWFEPGNRSMLEILLARIVWFGRKLDATHLTGAAEETGAPY